MNIIRNPLCFIAFLAMAAVFSTNGLCQDSKPKSAAKKKKPKYADSSETYKKVGERELKLYITRPDGWAATDQRPAVVFFHGGGWVGGAPGQFDEHCKHLSSRGMTCIQVEYRLLPKPNWKKDKPEISKTKSSSDTPAICINDAKSAMRWVRSHAKELGIDPNRIASGGGSAGGHLAAFLGTTDGSDDAQDDLSVSARSNAMLLFNPVYDNGPNGWGRARVGDRYQEFSPAHNISKDDAPAIVFLGTEDKLIPVDTAKKFQAQMKELGLKSELHLYEGAEHGFFNSGKKWFPMTIVEMDKFLTELGWLKGEPTVK
jgi:acetyl esterase/lipase